MIRPLIAFLLTLVATFSAIAAPLHRLHHYRHIPTERQLEQAEEEETDTTQFRGFIDLWTPDSVSLPVFRPLNRVALEFEPIFDDYRFRPFPGVKMPEPPSRAAEMLDSAAATAWLNEAMFNDSLISSLKQSYMLRYPQNVRFNTRMLPEPPKRFRAVIDPSQLIIVMEEIPDKPTNFGKALIDEKPINWLNTFNGSVQFSQAYISPNWYQGGNNALSMIAAVSHTIKLNQKLNPKYMFENYVSYKLALSSTPDDSLRNYTITEDIFQLTTKAGVKAFKYWFYSVQLNFKTQFLNGYPVNSKKLAVAFLSPGELNLGLGMTYDYTKPNKRFSVNASFSPLSWDFKTCIDHRINPTTFGIEEGRRTLSRLGSSAEIKLFWAITRDINYNMLLFAFTEYGDTQADWEHTIDFSINRFLSTKLYMHVRYDSTTPFVEGSNWHKWQFKEILSLGFAYKFSSI